MAGRGLKKCSVCGKTKPLAQFNRRKKMADGYRSECKTCQAIARLKYYRKEGK